MPELTHALVPALRANMAQIAGQLPARDVHDVRVLDADGVKVRLYRPNDDASLPLLVFLHGGAWVLGDLETHDAMHRELAVRADCAVLAVNYRLAPEHPYPAGLEDTATALRWARRSAAELGCDPARIALGGESAGANLAAALTLELRRSGEPQPLFQLLVHPATDLTFSYPSIDEVVVAGINRAFLEVCVAFYADKSAGSDPYVSPALADHHGGLAPAIILTVSEDPLRDDGERYASALVAAGVETTALRLDGLPHGFMFIPASLGAVDRAFDRVARLVRRAFAGLDGP